MDIHCPECGKDLSLIASASLPEETDLTLSLSITPGQLVRLDTFAGILASFRDLQIAVGDSMGCDTEVFLASTEMVGNELRFTTRIVNAARGLTTPDPDIAPKDGRG